MTRSPRCFRSALALLACAGLFLLSGCSGKKADVTGTVVGPDGKPLPVGKISIVPASGKGTAASADIENGSFTVTKAPVGECKITVGTRHLALQKQELLALQAQRKSLEGRIKEAKKIDKSDELQAEMDKIDGQIAKLKDVGAFVPIPEKYESPEKTPFSFTIKSGKQDIGELKIEK